MSNERHTSQHDEIHLPQHSDDDTIFLSPRGIMDFKEDDDDENAPYILRPLTASTMMMHSTHSVQDSDNTTTSTHVPILFLTPRHDSINSLAHSPWNSFHSYYGAQQEQQQERNLQRAQAATPPPNTNDSSNFYSSSSSNYQRRMILQVEAITETPNSLTLPTNF